MKPAAARSPPGTWRLLAPALLGWVVAAFDVTTPGSGQLIAGVAGVSGAALTGIAIAHSAKQRSLRVKEQHSEQIGEQHSELLSHSRGKHPIIGILLLSCAVLLLLGLRVSLAEGARADPEFESAAEHGRALVFESKIIAFPESKTGPFGEAYWVGAHARMPGGTLPVLLWLNDRPPEGWGPGMWVSVRGQPERFAPGDSNAYGVKVLDLQVLGAQNSEIQLAVTSVAARLRSGLRTASQEIPGAELVPGLAVGDTSLVSEELDQAMLASSLTHLTAVSGSNCALITGAVLWLLGRLGVSRRWRLAFAGLSLFAFVVLVGPDASVQRAAIMAAVLLSSGFGGRKASALPALGLAMLVLLIIDPWQSLEAGFALSVVATAGILLIATPLSRWFHRRARFPQVIALPIAVAVAAQFACGPLLLLLQPGIPIIGVAANVLAAPAAPVGTALGLLAALCSPLWPVLTDTLVWGASFPAKWIATTAHFAADFPGGRWHWPDGWTGALLLASCQLGFVLVWALRRGSISLPLRPGRSGLRVTPRQPWQSQSSTPRAIGIATALLLAVSLGLLIGITLAWPATEHLETPRGWAVVACDVGQGDALLLRDPAKPGEVMMVDTGDDPELLERCLERFRVDRISLLVLSHDDRDHVGALESIVSRVESALISPTVSGEQTDHREVVRQLEQAGVRYRVGRAGDERLTSSNGLSWHLLAPTTESPDDSNAASLVMMVDAGPTSVLLLADTGLEEQEAILSAIAPGGGAADTRSSEEFHADVLKVAHHGSRDQDPRLPAAVGANWALVSVGADNGYGHPASETITDLSKIGTQVLRTDRQGSIALVPGTDGELTPWVERGS